MPRFWDFGHRVQEFMLSLLHLTVTDARAHCQRREHTGSQCEACCRPIDVLMTMGLILSCKVGAIEQEAG